MAVTREQHQKIRTLKYKGYSRQRVADAMGLTFEEVKAVWRTAPEPAPEKPDPPVTDTRIIDFIERARIEREARIRQLEENQRWRVRQSLPPGHELKSEEEIAESMRWLARHS